MSRDTYLTIRGILAALQSNAEAAREQAEIAEEVVDGLADQDGEEAKNWRAILAAGEAFAQAFETQHKYMLSRLT